MRETRNAYKIFVGKSKYKRQLLRPNIKLEEILKMYAVRVWAGFIWLGIRSRGGHICNMVMNFLVP
jgi:hypothetical protein